MGIQVWISCSRALQKHARGFDRWVTEGVEMKKMKKLTFALSAATALAAATIGLAAPATAAAGPFPTDCYVHVIYQGNPVDVAWC
jgi:hypothetical protein